MKKYINLLTIVLMTVAPVMAQINGSAKVKDMNGNTFNLLSAKADPAHADGLKGYLGGQTFTIKWANIKRIILIKSRAPIKKGYSKAELEMINGEKHGFLIYTDFNLTGIKESTKAKYSLKFSELTEILFSHHR